MLKEKNTNISIREMPVMISGFVMGISVTVFITADLDDRISNVCKRRNCSAEEARKLIEDKESTRSSYYNYYSGKTWGASASYDLCVNASRLGAEGTKEFIAEFIRRRMKR